MSELFLGAKYDTQRASDLCLVKYIDKAKLIEAKSAPAAPNWETILTPEGKRPIKSRSALGNTRAGCCVFSAPGHMINTIRNFLGSLLPVVTEEMVLAAYKKWVGWNEETGENDNGYYIRSMLSIWANEGLFGSKLAARCRVNPKDQEEVALGIWLAGGLIGGYNLPVGIFDQKDSEGRQLWYVPAGGWPRDKGPGSLGGHAIYKVGTSPGGDTDISWGDPTTYTHGWRYDCCFELWLPLTREWVAAHRAPNGFAVDDLLADVRARSEE